MFTDNDVFTTTGVACDKDRLNYRYEVMFQPFASEFLNKTVLDLGIHNGRWSWVSLYLKAEKVVGFDKDSNIIEQARQNLKEKGFDNQFELHCENVELAILPKADIVLCMGILYYLRRPLSLISKISQLNPKLLIIDTFHSTYKVPNEEQLEKFLESLFKVKKLAKYDKNKRVAYCCRPKNCKFI